MTDSLVPPEQPEKVDRDEEASVGVLVAHASGATALPTHQWQAWSVLCGGWLLLFITFGYTNAFGVYQDYLTTYSTSSASDVSWIGSTQFFFFQVMALPAGRLLDKGYFRQTMVIGSSIYIVSLFMVSLAHVNKYYQLFLSLGIGMGIGSGLLYVPALAIQAEYWGAYHSFAMGMVMTGSAVGGICYPILLNQLLFHRNIGFGWSVRVSAFLTLGLLLLANVLMMKGLSSHQEESKDPKPLNMSIRIIFADTAYMVALVGLVLVFWGLYFPTFYLQLFTTTHGLNSTFAFYILAVMNAASLLGRIVPNYIAVHFGSMNILTCSTFVTGVLILGLLGVKTVAGVTVFAVLYGFFWGSVLSLISPTVTALSPESSQVGIRLGIGFALGSICCLTGTPINGALLGDDYQWYKPIIFSATVMLAGASILVCARTLFSRRQGTAWV